MEQKSDQNGLANLNPMYLWKFVWLDKTRNTPTVILDTLNENILELTQETHNCQFVVLEKQTFLCPPLPNLKLIWADNISEKRLYELYASADYVLFENENPNDWLPALFCGTTPIFDLETFRSVVKNIRVLTPVERLENWEKAENILTKINTTAILEV